MVYDRYSRGDGPRDFDDGRGYGGGRRQGPPGAYERGSDREGREGYGARSYGGRGYGRDDGPDRASGGWRDDRGHDYGRSGGDRGSYGRYEERGEHRDRGQQRDWYGGHASGGRSFEDAGRHRHPDEDARSGPDRGGYGGRPQGYQYEDRGFIARAGDEVRSWFGDDEAERRREADARYDERLDRSGSGRHDDDYRQWRSTQVSQLDRDYDEYRQENRSKFESEFATWRTTRQGQRDSLGQVKEHAEVVGSDGAHVGTVDKVRDDRILLTKNDAEAGGHHHSIPSRWVASVEDGKVTLSRTAAEAKAAWEDEDRNSAMFGYGDNRQPAQQSARQAGAQAWQQSGQQSGQQAGQRFGQRDGSGSDDATDGGRDAQGRMLNRSFPGTY